MGAAEITPSDDRPCSLVSRGGFAIVKIDGEEDFRLACIDDEDGQVVKWMYSFTNHDVSFDKKDLEDLRDLIGQALTLTN